jgi:hypothetical protein
MSETSAETPAEAPATDPPGATIYVCPACGTRYDEPTECTNGHQATETVPYVRSEVEAFDAASSSEEIGVAANWPEPAEGAAVPADAGADPQAVAEANATLAPPTPAEQVPGPVPTVPTEAPVAVEAETSSSAANAAPVEPAAPVEAEPAAPEAPVADVAAPAVELGVLESAIADLGAAFAAFKARLGVNG